MIIDHAAFWFIAGVMTGAAALLLALPLSRQLRALRFDRRGGLAMVGALVFVSGTATALYVLWGHPQAVHFAPSAAADSPVQVESMDDATQKLALRLSSTRGSRADWLLLAQAYDYLGRRSEAEEALANAEKYSEPAAAADIVAGNIAEAQKLWGAEKTAAPLAGGLPHAQINGEIDIE
jgi:hypothetical protein